METGILHDIAVNGVSIFAKPEPPPITLRGVKIPDGYEATGEYRPVKVGEYYLSDAARGITHQGPASADFPILRRKWTWPAWLKAPYIAMDENGGWTAYNNPPYLCPGYWNAGGRHLSSLQEMTDFTPPPCTDWRQSLTANPYLNQF